MQSVVGNVCTTILPLFQDYPWCAPQDKHPPAMVRGSTQKEKTSGWDQGRNRRIVAAIGQTTFAHHSANKHKKALFRG